MAKEGIDSFLLNCHTNDNISEIEAEFGVKGFAVIVRLWQKIYSEKGYYCEWIERSPLLFLSNWFGGNSGVTVSLIDEIVNRCLKNGIFNRQIYEKYSVLTSERIQEQYFDVVKRRESIPVIEEYLLVSVDKIKGNVYKNSISVNKNKENVYRNSTSKVKESKVKNNNICAAEQHDDDSLETFFESIWNLYPIKKGKGQVSKTKKQVLKKIGFEQIKRCVERFIVDMESEKRDRKYWMHGSTFFNSGYVDYLDCNYIPEKTEFPPVENENPEDEELVGDDW